MKVGLFFGSFNPIHIGHLILANFMLETNQLREVWFVVSPHNPHKDKKTLLKSYDRLEMVNLATDDNYNLKSCDIEFDMPQPSYTVDTLARLREKYPQKEFSIIMGEDNLRSFHKWKNYQYMLNTYKLWVYPRLSKGDFEIKKEILEHKNVNLIENAPVMKISATFIRNLIKEGKSIKYLVHPMVEEMLDKTNFYK